MSTPTSDSRHDKPHGVLPLRRGVLLPGETTTVPVGRAASIALFEANGRGATIVVAVQRDPSTEAPGVAELYPVATVSRVRDVMRDKRGGLRVILDGLHRIRLKDTLQVQPYLTVSTEPVSPSAKTPAVVALHEETKSFVRQVAKDLGFELPQAVVDGTEPGRFADRLAALLPLETEQKVEILQAEECERRLRAVVDLIKETATLWELRRKIGSELRREMSKEQRRALLRQQMRAIARELGEGTEDDPVQSLRDRFARADLPEEVQRVVDRELSRMEAGAGASAEQGVIRNYLELIADLPWNERVQVLDDIAAVSRRLDQDHEGLDEIKKRILEHLAVAKLSGNPQGTILCLVGPPGVGKTSLAQSVAAASGRPLVRIALGGVRDEAELRGHRRTYVGALPGRIVSAMRTAKVKNPVVVLDEIDKLGNGYWGSPEAALLEVLDPEQNSTFTDHYLELPFDLSEVMFITTANTLETLSPPLRDRLEIIELSGYTTEEKVRIAKRYLVPKRVQSIGLAVEEIELSDDALATIVQDYTRESGVRQLDRQIAKLGRAIALERVRGAEETPQAKRVIDAGQVQALLGRPRHRQEVAERVALPGVATGLAWTPVGGDILFVEASRMPGAGKLTITGKLGEVMQESARAALSYIRSHADELGIDADFLSRQDIHVHVPAGAVPKDGPSAGITIFTALASLLMGRRVRSDTAMTGECSLRGRVLPVGGIREKITAARRAGLDRVILPRRNEPDLEDVPAEVRDAMTFTLVDDMAEVLDAALEPLPFEDEQRHLAATAQ